MQTRVIVNGAHGKMGALACKTLSEHPDFKLVATLSRGDNLLQAIATTEAQIVVDFTRADNVFENTQLVVNAGVHPVIGTSGLLPHQITALKAQCDQQQLGALIVPNFSIGALLMMRFAEDAARLLPNVEIIEAHHPQKLDAPSGTAIKTAELISNARVLHKLNDNSKELLQGARGATHDGVPIHSIRLPGLLAQQQVIFGSAGETLSITHTSIDRQSFMPGVILACQKVTALNTLHYGLDTLIS